MGIYSIRRCPGVTIVAGWYLKEKTNSIPRNLWRNIARM